MLLLSQRIKLFFNIFKKRLMLHIISAFHAAGGGQPKQLKCTLPVPSPKNLFR